MRSTQITTARLQLIQKIETLEKQGQFHTPAEQDPPHTELMPDQVDYLLKKRSSRIKTKLANALGDWYFKRLMRKGQLLIGGVEGEENLSALANGAMLTCNHFSIADHYIVYHAVKKHLPKRYLHKIIREGNYTGFKGLYGFLFRHCNTLPLSSNRRTMIQFFSAVQTLLKKGETVLIYPEQEMWRNYKKPRPFLVGAFKIACKAGVPVVPIFITMQDSDTLDQDGCPLQKHTVHIMPAVYPDESLGDKERAEAMQKQVQEKYKEKYEQVYKQPLRYSCDGE